MARSRNIKPGFFLNEDLVELPYEYRLLFIGLWCMADREGRLENRPKKIKMQIFPADTLDMPEAILGLSRAKLITLYTIDNIDYIYIDNFLKHQHPHHKETKSVIPPPFSEASPVKVGADPSDSLLLIPDSPGSDSPNSDSLKPIAESLPITKPDLFDPEKPVENLPAKTSAPKKKAQPKETKTGETWKKYSGAYFDRYGTEPVRNATVNGQLSKLIDRIGKDEAPFVAEYFVTINNSYYVQRGHGIGILLADCEKIRTEWATNRSVTSTQAQQMDKTQTNGDVFQKLIAEAEEEERLNEQNTTH